VSDPDEDDTTMALRLAREATTTEADAYALISEAREQATALAATPRFQRRVKAIAMELLMHNELDAADVRGLTREDTDGQDPDA
jgi:hypothetical protein